MYNKIRAKIYRIKRRNLSFEFEGKEYKYLNHYYNCTFNNERAVEIPILLNILEDYKSIEVLEVGNVLSHYMKVYHDVVDKNENCNCKMDIIDFNPGGYRKYDLIIAISTLEHIGFDMGEDRDPKKIFEVIKVLQNSLKDGGRIIVTIPIGQNLQLDKFIFNADLTFTEISYMKRINNNKNEWKQCSRNEIENLKYDFENYHANGILIGIIDKYE